MSIITGVIMGLLLSIIIFWAAFDFGFQYAKEIAIGMRRVKPSKDFMREADKERLKKLLKEKDNG